VDLTFRLRTGCVDQTSLTVPKRRVKVVHPMKSGKLKMDVGKNLVSSRGSIYMLFPFGSYRTLTSHDHEPQTLASSGDVLSRLVVFMEVTSE
jgi:hypothetical protein